ncbi:lipid asymmetry maintenance protein MlaB [Rahnella sp. C60]|uniref:Lipid asymmetry maintenance protein MlaB n=1 Tax=Rahnella perminowiae TaxID=2816244 RepID=A0ABS6KZ91_9GAMM|nr:MULTISPECIES: lipid asymmetry maintenance protein MlaB [Rahnella]UJD91126.1 lipid asymmetry maintenance protein MlaB [Rahnella aquatilis]MBU9812862.1 lipid asymmetry maintenance protein MlaB [Rahnella perminowiae]MBU9817056.1 lipid asymmetry maintenance protein MlaB [Rahnella perminowiae]MBU9827265.1 lipid asymmetry maintenance protein MlaB [Rahnella perminowiae]MBU9834924.1 lipid asymmetry maintenance protein MlaB [Rahnella perminowiae]
MSEALRWESQPPRLSLHGELDRETLVAFWDVRKKLMPGVTCLDVSGLARVDSSGLALLVHLREEASQQGITLTIAGITDRLRTLIALYNLQDIIPSETTTCSVE